MKFTYCLIISVAAIFLSACHTSKPESEQPPVESPMGAQVVGLSPQAMMPKAVIYRMNGDYQDHVFVNVDGDRIVSYPAPTDVSEASAPVDLGDGWWLDRRGGIGTNSAFTTYTWAQYAALPAVPSLQELSASIITGARVTRVERLPITASQAAADPAEVRKYIPND